MERKEDDKVIRIEMGRGCEYISLIGEMQKMVGMYELQTQKEDDSDVSFYYVTISRYENPHFPVIYMLQNVKREKGKTFEEQLKEFKEANCQYKPYLAVNHKANLSIFPLITNGVPMDIQSCHNFISKMIRKGLIDYTRALAEDKLDPPTIIDTITFPRFLFVKLDGKIVKITNYILKIISIVSEMLIGVHDSQQVNDTIFMLSWPSRDELMALPDNFFQNKLQTHWEFTLHGPLAKEYANLFVELTKNYDPICKFTIV